MAAPNSKVLAGEYSGSKIDYSPGQEWAYIVRPNNQFIFFNKLNVQKIVDAASFHTEASMLDTAIATEFVGVGAGMTMAQGKGTRLKQVIWKNGTKSLIEVDAQTEKALIVGMYKDTSREEEQRVKSQVKTFNETFSTIYVIVVIGYIALYLFSK